MLTRLLLLGQIPGTNIDLTFWQVIGLIAGSIVWVGLHRWEPFWLSKSVHFVRQSIATAVHQVRFIRPAQLIGRKG